MKISVLEAACQIFFSKFNECVPFEGFSLNVNFSNVCNCEFCQLKRETEKLGLNLKWMCEQKSEMTTDENEVYHVKHIEFSLNWLVLEYLFNDVFLFRERLKTIG